MESTTITPQNVATFEAWLTAGLIPSYKMGGKIQAAYQTYVQACMSELIGAKRAPQRAQRSTPSATATKTPPAAATNTPVRRRGRPPKATGTPQAKTSNPSNLSNLVLAAVSFAGTPRSTVLANPTLKGARSNHIGIAIKRHITAGRFIEQDGMLYNRATEQRAAA